jgi:peptide/nickel transport system ATP-binding protein
VSEMVPALDVRDLRVELEASGEPIVRDVSIAVAPGEVLGIVGESGSGKTTTALAILGFARPGVKIVAGSVSIAGHDMLAMSESRARKVRGRVASYVPQEPASTINPSIRIGDWVGEIVRAHFPEHDPEQATVTAFERVGLPSDRGFRRRFVHELSGGQAQRVAIATGFVGQAPVVVLDEPTTGLDVVTQATILREIARLQQESGVAMVYVSHDLSVVGSVAGRIAVMYAGRVVEHGPTERILRRPRHPYARGLIASVPDHVRRRRIVAMPGVALGVGADAPGCAFAPRCPQRVDRCDREVPGMLPVEQAHGVRCFEWERTPAATFEPALEMVAPAAAETPLLAVRGLEATYRSRRQIVKAAEVSFDVRHGESVALVGESGSGKTTIARCVAGLHIPDAGEILLDGEPLAPHARSRPLAHRRRVQIVFQNPNASLNPDHTVEHAVARPLQLLLDANREDARREVRRLLELVRLPASVASRYPREISGGERQRVAIARALAARPDLVICDEITSALDVSVQAAVLEVLADLRAELRLALLFISHDLGVVGTIADRILVLKDGVLREEGATGDLLAEPADPYTRLLVASAPRVA